MRKFEQFPQESMFGKVGMMEPQWQTWFHLIADKMPLLDTYRVSITPTSVGANSTSAQVFSSLTYKDSDGNTINDPSKTVLNTADIVVHIEPPSETSGIGISHSRVTAGDELTVQFMNVTGGGVTPVSGIYKIIVLRG